MPDIVNVTATSSIVSDSSVEIFHEAFRAFRETYQGPAIERQLNTIDLQIQDILRIQRGKT